MSCHLVVGKSVFILAYGSLHDQWEGFSGTGKVSKSTGHIRQIRTGQ